MPTGIYKRTAEHRRIISEALKKSGHTPSIFKGEKSSRWKGGRILRHGYIHLKVIDHPTANKQGYIPEHRLVMEKYLGRYLFPKEVVHHVNHIKSDNRIENLELCESAGKHTRDHHPEIAERQRITFKGLRRSPNTEFKKGMIPWNKRV